MAKEKELCEYSGDGIHCFSWEDGYGEEGWFSCDNGNCRKRLSVWEAGELIYKLQKEKQDE